MIKTDYLVIGSGIAGLSFAIKASDNGTVSLITKRNLFDSSTGKAQGGVACVTDKEDSFAEHIQDTLVAGAGLCDEEMVELLVKSAPARIEELIKLGVKFTKKDYKESEFELGLEGGHSKRRILHAGDITGNEIERVLIENINKKDNIIVYEDHMAVDLLIDKNQKEKKCYGAYIYDINKRKVELFVAKVVILATGGTGKVYLYTSNPDVATGDGVAMAYRAGADIANMEFMQFHPTCLYNPQAKSFLISEAVRGEGAILKNQKGEAFMSKYHLLKDLAPRDIVARAIDTELKNSGDHFVYLDITSKPNKFFLKRFPNIYEKCLKYGIDMSKDMIPVVPAAHYCCGGIDVNKYAQTTITNLFAIGETACNGVHGANRLASNSLLDGLVSAELAYQKSKEMLENIKIKENIKNFINESTGNGDPAVMLQNWDEIRRLMWNYAGIVRTDDRLSMALKRIKILNSEVAQHFKNFKVSIELLELRNILDVAEIIVMSAMARKESVGLHYSLDYPEKSTKKVKTIINKQQHRE
ncbi:MAG: L-aspartate oxidase [Endomicrobiia bacterium]|nr:L-aspartate oxidase [Endomicrobiaceae bacterium]MDD3053430.1 L-aspartate oxidase [Endomicrobiaceae bacterium]